MKKVLSYLRHVTYLTLKEMLFLQGVLTSVYIALAQAEAGVQDG